MEDSSSNSPPTKILLPKRANPPSMEVKNTLFSLIPTPPFRRSSTTLAFSSAFIFITCSIIFVFGTSHVHQSSAKWLNNMIRNRSHLSSYFPHHLLHDNSPKQSNHSRLINPNNATSSSDSGKFSGGGGLKNATIGDLKENAGANNSTGNGGKLGKIKKDSWLKRMSRCDIYDGKWVRDDSPPLYEPGSCTLMDESFNCFQNGRPDNDYVHFSWKPNRCSLPRLNGQKMLRFMRGKRIVYVGDSLGRNMWESMVCLLRNSVEDKSRVFEASGKQEFKKEGTYSFLFSDYNVSVEYFRSAFLVQEWEMPLDNNNGSKKETLRIDMVEQSFDTYKDADVLIFNTGNWWTHEKTSQGKGYYQEGDHVHEQLDVVEAFNKAMTTWARWVESNIDPMKTHVFFRSHSFSHFSKGEWNSGGRCDSTEPITDTKDLLSLDELYPPLPQMLDKSVEKVKIPVSYLNVTRMTNYRRDAHPSLYRKPNMTEEERSLFETHQDCSHWCLPGVPDTWNQLLFAHLLMRHKQRQLKQQSLH